MIGAQIRKLAKPIIKKVGMSFWGRSCSNQIEVSALAAHKSINVQNTRRVIFSVISLTTHAKGIGYLAASEPGIWQAYRIADCSRTAYLQPPCRLWVPFC